MKELFRRTPGRFTSARRDADQQIPENLWTKCPACGEITYVRQLNDQLKVCKCGHHMRLSVAEWLQLFDRESFVEEDRDLAPVDALQFVSAKDNYAQKLRETQAATGMNDALLTGRATLDGAAVQLAISNWEFIGGSMGSVFGERLARATERAAERGVPLVTITATGGARQHEGVLSLMQMAKTNMALTRLSAARQLHIALLVDPCYAGVLASYASVADVIIAEPGARIGFAGRRVIEQTIRQKLPASFQTAEFLLEHGMVDMVTPRGELRATIRRLIGLHAPAAAQLSPSDAGVLREPLRLS